MFKVVSPIKHHVLVGAKCRIFKTPNYCNKMEELGPDYETLNNVCVRVRVKSAACQKAKCEGGMDQLIQYCL
jgi:hypothetical protein